MSKEHKYDAIIDLDSLDPKSAHGQIIGMIQPNSRVLEIGCATGYISRCLKEEKKCSVVGVEVDSEAAQKANRYCDQVIAGSAENEETFGQLSGTFDIIVMAAVLEHLVEPDRVLRRVRDYLRKDGYMILSLPNIAHWTIRRDLLFGKFEYSDYGLLDNTHLRFFTFLTAKQMIDDCGYFIDYFSMTTSEIPGVIRAIKRVPFLGERIREHILDSFPNFFGYELIFKIRPFD